MGKYDIQAHAAYKRHSQNFSQNCSHHLSLSTVMGESILMYKSSSPLSLPGPCPTLKVRGRVENVWYSKKMYQFRSQRI